MRVLIVEDQPLLLQVLKVMVSSVGGEVVAEATSAEEALGLVSGCDVILMDVSLPEEDGIWCTRTLRSRGFHQPVIMVTSHECVHVARASLAAGANGYLYKSCSPALLSQALAAVLRGRTFVQPALLRALKSAMA